MAKTPVGDVLSRALRTIDELVEMVRKHEEILDRVTGQLTDVERRLLAIEKTRKP
ncbi:MAG TPA: hypothetical protein VHB27_19545 [Rhodopila sp.]|uniref:hypothetical protein n=1 Tax=Rhodopila sp. TaxID=2480087 RepID=UPI002D119E40|nr:hypothetical protein [Rhodopila sp.]HVY17426.1 hypothetical protein [Rhodopila sp.]